MSLHCHCLNSNLLTQESTLSQSDSNASQALHIYYFMHYIYYQQSYLGVIILSVGLHDMRKICDM